MKNYCIDCKKKISPKAKRCKSCSKKGELNINYNPESHKPNYCISCEKEIWHGSIRCENCWHKFMRGNNNPFYGRKHTNETKEKIGLSELNNKYFLNKHHSNKIRKKLSEFAKKRIGELNPNWQDGISFEEYGAEFDSALKEQVRFRDKYKCQICGCSQLENGRQLDCHHINYNKKHNELNNLIALCYRCHIKTNGNRDYWFAYFTYIMERKNASMERV